MAGSEPQCPGWHRGGDEESQVGGWWVAGTCSGHRVEKFKDEIDDLGRN